MLDNSLFYRFDEDMLSATIHGKGRSESEASTKIQPKVMEAIKLRVEGMGELSTEPVLPLILGSG